MIPFGSSPARYHDEGYAAWLRYAPLPPDRDVLPGRLVVYGKHEAAALELRYGVQRMLGRPLMIGAPSGVTERVLSSAGTALPHSGAIHLGTLIELELDATLKPDGFLIRRRGDDLFVAGADDRGTLYAAFTLLRRLALGQELEVTEEPSTSIRFVNHWDNPDGTIERGYAGRSIFYEGMRVTEDLARVADYARLLASVGINGCSLNNVNANDWVYSTEALPEVAKLADAIRPYGVRTLLSVRFDSPKRAGLATYDPLVPEVAEWWRAKVDEIYRHIPDLFGLVIKADSEGEAGPSAAGRTHADAANMLARALEPHGGVVFYRGFVYDHRMDWRDRSLDRAKAQHDNFKPLDGQFAPNAILQVKNGPIDFQVREPVSPTFLALKETRTVCEVMITQEYLGQQHHTVYEVPWWKDALAYPGVLDVINQNGFVAVCGVGRNANWLGNHLAQANLYGYGRLAWDPSASSEEIAREWAGLTFSPEVSDEVTDLLMRTWPAYEDYTGNLGIGGLTDIIHVHYGPSPISSEHNGWGQWHRSDEHGTGMDRTVATGTGMTAQYPSRIYESLETCPEELLLFFHHVPYTHRLASGSTVIQHIYDRHYAGAEAAAGFVEDWRRLRGRIDERRFLDVLAQLEYQSGHALVWRDAVCQYFSRLSGIPDAHGRVFHEPNRYEAERMTLDGYEVVEVEPWEAASGAQAIALTRASGTATLAWAQEGLFDIAVWHFDPTDGRAEYELRVNRRLIDAWRNSGRFPSTKIDGHTKTRRLVHAVELRAGDEITVHGRREGEDRAALDFLEVIPR